MNDATRIIQFNTIQKLSNLRCYCKKKFLFCIFVCYDAKRCV